LADPHAKGILSGLTLDANAEDLALLYLAAVQSIAYGTRHIIEHCNAHGLQVFIQEHANIVGCPVALPREKESVLLGAAVLGAVAAKKFVSIREAMMALNAPGLVVEPSQDPRVKKYHDAKYSIFRSMYEQQVANRETMAAALA
jgi:ribulose kinase